MSTNVNLKRTYFLPVTPRNPGTETGQRISSSSDTTEHHHEHRLMTARSILQNLLLQTFHRDRAKMLGSAVPREISYHDGETIATVHTDLQGNITRCSLFEIK